MLINYSKFTGDTIIGSELNSRQLKLCYSLLRHCCDNALLYCIIHTCAKMQHITRQFFIFCTLEMFFTGKTIRTTMWKLPCKSSNLALVESLCIISFLTAVRKGTFIKYKWTCHRLLLKDKWHAENWDNYSRFITFCVNQRVGTKKTKHSAQGLLVVFSSFKNLF